MRSQKQSQKKKVNKTNVFLGLFFTLIVCLGLVFGYYGSQVMQFLDVISVTDEEDDDSVDSLEFARKLDDLEPFSILILGLDADDGGDRRADTIIVATVNPQSNDIKMVSVPRDTLVTLANGNLEKINAAYPTGGAILTRSMVSDVLDIPIHFYASLDFEGLVELVDAVGGVTVDSELDFTEGDYTNKGETIHIREGKQTLGGAEALAYSRMRKQDPLGDFGRQARQQEIIIQTLDELASINTIANLSDILDAVGNHLTTNATTKQMFTIATNYSDAVKNVEQLTIEGDSSRTYFPHYGFDVYTWEPFDDSLYEVQETLKNHLGRKVNDTTIHNVDGNQ